MIGIWKIGGVLRSPLSPVHVPLHVLNRVRIQGACPPFFINRKCEEKGVHLRRGTEGYCLSRSPELAGADLGIL